LFYTLWANSANQEYYETQPGACQTTSIRFGYAGYVRDASVNNGSDTTTFGERNYTGAMAGLYHVRHRAYDPELGRWTRRDPIGYVDGMGLYEYVNSSAIDYVDPFGTLRGPVTLPPLLPTPVRPGLGPIWTPDPIRIPGIPIRTPGIFIPANQCILIGVIFYCIGEELSPRLTPAPISPVPRVSIPWLPGPDCTRALAEKKAICTSPGVPAPAGGQGGEGSEQRRKWCDWYRRERDRVLECRRAIGAVNDICRGGDWTSDTSGYDHLGEFVRFGRAVEHRNGVLLRVCPAAA